MDKLTIQLGNVHCDACMLTVKDSVSEFFTLQTDKASEVASPIASHLPVQTSKPSVKYILNEGQLVLAGAKGVLASKEKAILASLEDKGFDVVSSDLEADQYDGLSHTWHPINLVISKMKNKIQGSKRSRHHIENCTVCQMEEKEREKDKTNGPHSSAKRAFKKVFPYSSSEDESDTLHGTDSDSVEVVVGASTDFRALIAIGGMTCASCSNAVTAAIRDILVKHDIQPNEDVLSVSVVSKSAVVIIPNSQMINSILLLIRDIGYSATLMELLPVERSTKYKVEAAIGGMTCAACSSAIENLVKDLPFVVECVVSVVTKNGIFVIDSNTKQNLKDLQDAVEDVGYNYNFVKVSEISHAAKKSMARTVNLKVEGMFCEHCPEEVNNYLSKHGNSIVISDPITLQNPFVRFTYLPSPPELTIRKLVKDLNELSPNFKVEMIKSVTLEEHMKRAARKEAMKIVKRLVLTITVAIPTFIIGVVCMSLLPKHHHLRMWFMEPIWCGNVSRAVWALFILSTPVFFFADDIFHEKSIKEVRSLWRHNVPWTRRLFQFGSMSLLMSLGTSVAYFSSVALLGLSANSPRESNGYSTTYFDSVVFLTLFLLIGRLLEAYSKSKTADAVTRLSDIKPQMAHYVEMISNDNAAVFGNDEELKVDFLEVGDYIRVAPGESPAADAIIIQGESKFDESALTGESNPVTHVVGEQVFSGTVNVGSTSLICKIAALEGTSLIDQIVNAVQEGQMKKAPIERTADILTGIFVPVICFIAVITWIIWLSLGYSGALPQSYLDIDVGGWSVWSMEFAIAVFVVACPCGIGLAAPTALFVGSGLAAKYGILAKGGGTAFQDGAKVNVVCFDKTGTLTLGGDPKVTEYAILNEKGSSTEVEKMAIQIARDTELSSRHPLSIAVKNFAAEHAKKFNFKLLSNIVPEVEEILGKGLKGDIVLENGNQESAPTSAIIGNEALLNQFNSQKLTTKQQNVLTSWKEDGKSVIILALQWESMFNTDSYVPVLMMASRDQIRPEAKNVIALLHAQKISCWMISGDNATTANAIAKQLGIDNVVAEVLPEEKTLKVEWIQNTFHAGEKEKHTKRAVVAMVGDGINDAPALAAADIGIALGSGSDLALSSSDFVLLSPNYPLISLLNLFSLSKAVFRRVKFNFGWALVYNMIGVPISAGVIYPYNNSRLSPVWASAAMAASSISVILSSLALRVFKPPKVEMDDTTFEDKAAARVEVDLKCG